VSNLPTPEQAEALAMPADERGGFQDGKSGFPTFQTEQSQAQRTRSVGVSLGRLTERWRTPM
jgi:hypothetical protein